eukprot:c12628_g1_i1.p1 GENE.c12628_g1_i1~~c12628_g1_i1.p1  ORF type:complete len:525 (+),score=119.67 c12628_g1_i1:32-1576(+)
MLARRLHAARVRVAPLAVNLPFRAHFTTHNPPPSAVQAPQMRPEWAHDVYETLKSSDEAQKATFDIKAATYWVMAGLELRSLKRLHEAETLFSEAYAVACKNLGLLNPDLMHFGQVYFDTLVARQKYDEAEKIGLNLIAIIRHVNRGKPSSELAEMLQRVAIVIDMQNHHTRAKDMFQEALSLYQNSANTKHTAHVAKVLEHIAATLDKSGDHTAAEAQLRHAIALYEKSAGFDTNKSANALHSLGCCLETQGRTVEAEMAFRKSLHLRSSAVEKRPPTDKALNKAEQQQQGGDLDDGMKDPIAALTLHTLAELYAKQHDLKQALPLLRKAAKIRASLFGDSSPETTATIARATELSTTLQSQIDAEKQAKLGTEAAQTIALEKCATALVTRKSADVSAVLSEMEAQRESMVVQEKGCNVLYKLGALVADGMDARDQQRAVLAVLASMRAHPTSIAVHVNACLALHSLGEDDGMRRMIVAEGGGALLNKTLDTFPRLPRLRMHAVQAMQTLGVR